MKQNKKRISRGQKTCSVILAVLLACLLLMPSTAYAEGINSGTCGDNLTWTLDDNGILTIAGTGQMDDYDIGSDVPWYSCKDQIKTVVIENGVTSIGKGAFYACINLESVVIPESVTSIGAWAFTRCALSSVDIPSSVKNIGDHAFSACLALESVSIPGSVESIGSSAFVSCTSLQSVTIPRSVECVEENAFRNCTALKSVTILSGSTEFDSTAFEECTSLEAVYYYGTQAQWEEVKDAFPDDVEVYFKALVAVEAYPQDGGAVSGGSEYPFGNEVKVTAKPNNGYVFECWTEKGERIDGAGATYSFTAESNRVLVAYFQEVSISEIPDQFYTGSQIKPSGIKVELSGVDIKLTEGKDYEVSYGENVDVGTGTVYLTFKGDFVGEASAEFQIIPDPDMELEVELEGKSFEYDGTAHALPEAAATNALSGETEILYSKDGENWTDDLASLTATHVADSCTIYVRAVNKNYSNAAESSAELTITKCPIIITVFGQTYTYTGEKQSPGDIAYEDNLETVVKVEGLMGDDELTSIVIDGEAIDAGEYEDCLQASGAQINGEDEADSDYEITYVPGKLTISPAAVTITVESASKVEGEDDPVFTGTVEGLIKDNDLGEIKFVRTGTDEEPGTYGGVLTAEYMDNPNYVVKVINGDFTIEEKPIVEFTITFVDEDGTVLQTVKVAEGEMPAYTGETPTKPDTEDYTYTFSGWTPEIVPANGDATYTATYTEEEIEKPVYSVTEGGDGSWTKGSGEAFTITVKRSIDDASCFSHYVETLIDGKAVSVSAKGGSTIITISADVLESLSTGTHTITFKFDDGEVETKLTINAASTPTDTDDTPTGDQSHWGLWISLLALSGMGFAAIFVHQKKHKARG